MYVYGFHSSAPRTRTYTCLKGSPEIHTGKFLWAGLFHMLMSERIISTIWGKGSPGGSVGKESTCNMGDLGLTPGLGRSPGGGNGNPLQYSCLENPMNRGAWRAAVHGVTKNRIQLND